MAPCQSPAPCERLSIKLEEAATAPWSSQSLAASICSDLNGQPTVFLPEGSTEVENPQRWTQAGSATTQCLSDADGRRVGVSRPLSMGQMAKSTGMVSDRSECDIPHNTYLLCDFSMSPQSSKSYPLVHKM